jgi:hypothetical protein
MLAFTRQSRATFKTVKGQLLATYRTVKSQILALR